MNVEGYIQALADIGITETLLKPKSSKTKIESISQAIFTNPSYFVFDGISPVLSDALIKDLTLLNKPFLNISEIHLSAIAILNLSKMHTAVGTQTSIQKGSQLLEYVRHLNYGRATFNLASEWMKDSKKNKTIALQLYQEAMDSGVKEAAEMLGECHYVGIATEVNREKAFEIFSKLADQGDPNAQYRTATCLLYGDGTKKNIQRALLYATKSSEQGVPAAWNLIGGLFFTGTFLKKDISRARMFFKAAADTGLMPAQANLRLLEFLSSTQFKNGSS